MKKIKWIIWNVVPNPNNDKSLEGFGYKIVESLDSQEYNCALPLVHFKELAEKYGTLHVLRSPSMRPRDPYELVKFIKMKL